MSSDQQDTLFQIKSFWATKKTESPIYHILLTDIEICSASSTGSILARLLVKPIHLNSHGTLHGAVSTCLIDWAGGMAIAATGREKTGVSTDMHTSFVSTARDGDALEISAKAVKMGGTLAFTTVEIKKVGKDGEEGKIVSLGSHTKCVR